MLAVIEPIRWMFSFAASAAIGTINAGANAIEKTSNFVTSTLTPKE